MKIIDDLGAEVTKKWLPTLTPGLLFYLSGLSLLLTKYSAWSGLIKWIQDRAALPQVILLIIVTTAAAAITGYIVRAFTDSLILLLEGYWPKSFCKIQARRIASKRKRLKLDEELNAIYDAKQDAHNLSDEETCIFSILQEKLKWMPDEEYLMPTKFGNILRAAETRPLNKYGLDGVVLWPRLWFVLPDIAREEVKDARKKIDDLAQVWLWGALFWIWAPFLTIWFFIPIIIGSIVSAYAYRNMLLSARIYADLLNSIFDLYRIKVYEALRWPVPNNPKEEYSEGQKLTQYLLRGSHEQEPSFINSTSADK